MSQEHEHHDGHGHHGSPFVQHHYDDAQHQFDAGKLGIWFFLVQEILFFSGLFVAYILYRHHHPEVYAYAHHYLDVKWGAINTGVLIISSLTAAWAVRCAQLNQQKALVACLAITILCACGFLGIKYVEYSHKIHEHILFGKKFDPCVASGGAHLLNKGNKCPGMKTSIEWDKGTNTAKKGCLEGDYDWDPETHGIQAKCLVSEIKVTGPEGKRTEVSRRPIPSCGPEVGSPEALEEARLEREKGYHPGHEKAHKHPCWELSINPSICPKGPGTIVAYGDEAEREDIEIEAKCEVAPPPAAAPADPYGDVGGGTAVGQASFHRDTHKLTKHEQQEEMSNGPPPPHTNMFFSIYFAMTGLHGLHVLVGIFVFIWLLIRAIKGQFTPDYFGPIDYAALYWHLVDLIWIFLFPLLYLIH